MIGRGLIVIALASSVIGCAHQDVRVDLRAQLVEVTQTTAARVAHQEVAFSPSGSIEDVNALEDQQRESGGPESFEAPPVVAGLELDGGGLVVKQSQTGMTTEFQSFLGRAIDAGFGYLAGLGAAAGIPFLIPDDVDEAADAAPLEGEIP